MVPCWSSSGLVRSVFFLSIPFIILALFALPPSRNSNPELHNGPSSPLPSYGGTCRYFHRENNSAFSSLVDWRRIVTAAVVYTAAVFRASEVTAAST